MVLAAGRGERLRPLTDTCPKPLIKVGKKSMLDHALDELLDQGVNNIVVNACHHAPMIADHVGSQRKGPRIFVSHEEEALETGGGVMKALPFLGSDPFYVINGDILWENKDPKALELLEQSWTEDMDALLLMVPLAQARGYQGLGDYEINAGGQLYRRNPGSMASYVYGGVQILHPRLFQGEKQGRFSLNKLYDKAEKKGTLYGVRHNGLWFHVGTPRDLEKTRTWFHENALDQL